MKVLFLRTKDDGSQETIGTAELKKGRVLFKDLSRSFTEDLHNDGILYNGKRYYPEDGAAFLELLPTAFSGSRLRATIQKGG